MHQAVDEMLQQWPLQERPEHLPGNSPGKPAQERQLRSAQEEEGRNNHGQQHVLHHVSAQHEGGKSIQGRRERQVNRRQAREEAGQSREGISCRNLPTKFPPAAQVNKRRGHQTEGGHRQESPRGQNGGFCVHGNLYYRRDADLQEENPSLTFAVLFVRCGSRCLLLRRNGGECRVSCRWLTLRAQGHHIAHHSLNLKRR